MKFFIDENMNAGCVPPLTALYLEHQFSTAWSEGLSGEKDLDLFEELRRRRFDAIITKDRNQLRDTDERRALADCNLHWIGYPTKRVSGLMGLALETATVTAGLAYVLREWRNEPHEYLLRNIPHDTPQRVKISPMMQPTPLSQPVRNSA